MYLFNDEQYTYESSRLSSYNTNILTIQHSAIFDKKYLKFTFSLVIIIKMCFIKFKAIIITIIHINYVILK
jgi:hypothetical protein